MPDALLYLEHEAAGTRLSSGSPSRAWRISRTESCEEADHLASSRVFDVGLVAFPRSDERFIAGVEELVLRNYRMEWVALAPQDAFRSAALRSLIADTFYDHLSPRYPNERLESTLARALAKVRLRGRLERASGVSEPMMSGKSTAIQKLLSDLRKVASVDAPVLITGESGTGKELAARAIHQLSKRGAGQLVVINCAALTPTLAHAELFGHERGAFTGASGTRRGLIEEAEKGTIFFDEIGDLPPDLQKTLLRFLQERTITRLGSAGPVTVDTRVIAATNADLEAGVRDQRFREDLYYRLNVLRLTVPPLRDRREDVELLAWDFFRKFANERGGRLKGFSGAAIRAMQNYAWPGNVRELMNCIRNAVIMADRSLITPRDLGIDRAGACTVRVRALNEARALAEREAIELSLRLASNNVTRAARDLGISRPTLYRLITKHKIAAADALFGS